MKGCILRAYGVQMFYVMHLLDICRKNMSMSKMKSFLKHKIQCVYIYIYIYKSYWLK